MDPYIGEVKMFAGTYAPVNWAICDGSLMSISENEVLFTLLGTTYGGDGITTFALPDMRGRAPVHAGTGAGLPNVVLGQKAGTENSSLTINQMPSHSHTIAAQTAEGNTNLPTGNVFADTGATDPDYAASSTANVIMGLQAIGLSGNNVPYSICQPSLCITFIIALVGIFPSQN